MMSNADGVDLFSIKGLLEGADNYLIPMYQRNYAWDEAEITQLIQDVIDYVPADKDYYIGTLVVSKRKDGLFEVIDGQQRLTTLTLLVAYLGKQNKDPKAWGWYDQERQKQKLRYESRGNSSNTLGAILSGETLPKLPRDSIQHGYTLIHNILPKNLTTQVDFAAFTKFLLERVQIMRVRVPDGTDLNHYFEIMNSRGEQLEKHEVLKADLMAALEKGIADEDEKKRSLHCLHVVWEACANMEKYVQQGFTSAERPRVFGDNWDAFIANDFDAVSLALSKSRADEKSGTHGGKQSLTDIITLSTVPLGKKTSSEEEKDTPDRFHAVINFPNFLLQVLCVTTGGKVILDDKKLIVEFKEKLLQEGDDHVAKIKQFIFDLLRCKYLFDHYVIKRDLRTSQEGHWSLLRYKKTTSEDRADLVNTFGNDKQEADSGGDNRRILMLLSAFHVSAPTMVYKYWLNAALHHLLYADAVKAESYLGYLESVARAFVFDRYLSVDKRAEYYDVIYTNKGVCLTSRDQVSDESLAQKLSYDNIENNLVFNYLDYLLWCNDQRVASKFDTFKFTFRSSVEHLYPQTPFDGKNIDKNILNSFGNLCLISHDRNSTLWNRSPKEKKDYYQEKKILDSLKQERMFKEMHELGDRWEAEAIKQHFEGMKKVLLDSLVSTS